LTNFIVNAIDSDNCQGRLDMLDVEVIDQPGAAAAALDPARSRLLAELQEPASAATLATRLGLKRQGINYHLRTLEEHGLIQVADTRTWGGLTERLMVASAASYAVSPSVFGRVAADPERSKDRLAASYLVALGARVVREVGDLLRRARQADKDLAMLAIDTEIRFASPADRAAFTRDLTQAVATLASRYHNASAPGGRAHRLIVVAHPTPTPTTGKDA
jgi:DNA-binding transcriptional ArsR family regulator